MSCEGTIKLNGKELDMLGEVLENMNFVQVQPKKGNVHLTGHYKLVSTVRPFPCVDVYASGKVTFSNGASSLLLDSIRTDVCANVVFIPSRS